MPLEYHKILCHHAFGDIYFHERIVLFNTETQMYYHRANDDVDPLSDSPIFTEDEEYMRENNYVNYILTLDAYAFIKELEQVIEHYEDYEYFYERPEYSYFGNVRNKCSINPDDDLPF